MGRLRFGPLHVALIVGGFVAGMCLLGVAPADSSPLRPEVTGAEIGVPSLPLLSPATTRPASNAFSVSVAATTVGITLLAFGIVLSDAPPLRWRARRASLARGPPASSIAFSRI